MDVGNYTLRLLAKEDLDTYFEMVSYNRKRLENFFTGTVSRTDSYENTKTFVSEMLERVQARTYFPYVLIDNSNGRLAGFFDMKNIDWSIPKTELGCYIDLDYENKGITSMVMKAFIEICFTEYQFEKIFFRTHTSNHPVHRIAEKCGFTIEGTLRKDYKTTSGELVDLVYYGMLREEAVG